MFLEGGNVLEKNLISSSSGILRTVTDETIVREYVKLSKKRVLEGKVDVKLMHEIDVASRSCTISDTDVT
ncbi:hypothetical protein WN51_05502 [Melipona quadrifasciata]|uniref:Uncharacterized protein n=1 Tax=Melipona quadrifasciata TaxID=166423 RepID=A0A0M9AAP0_9HYME|nr:hypothetical protein WN51_05502 [Melipona quadrifasciata]